MQYANDLLLCFVCETSGFQREAWVSLPCSQELFLLLYVNPTHPPNSMQVAHPPTLRTSVILWFIEPLFRNFMVRCNMPTICCFALCVKLGARAAVLPLLQAAEHGQPKRGVLSEELVQAAQSHTLLPGGVQVRGEDGEVVVPQGEVGDGDEDGDEVLEQPPQPPVLPLPEWLQKALGKDSAVCCKAAAAFCPSP